MWSSGTGRQSGFASLFNGGLDGRSAEGQSVIPVYPMSMSVASPNGMGESASHQNHVGGGMRNTGEMNSGLIYYMGAGKGESVISPYPVASARINNGGFFNQESASMSGNHGMNENARPGQENGVRTNYGGNNEELSRTSYGSAKPAPSYGSESGMSGEYGKPSYGANNGTSYGSIGRENNAYEAVRESSSGERGKSNNSYTGGRENGERHNAYSGGTEAEAKEGINDIVSGLVSFGSMMSNGKTILSATWSVAAPIISAALFLGFL